jgi:hypothetical protein
MQSLPGQMLYDNYTYAEQDNYSKLSNQTTEIDLKHDGLINFQEAK